MNDLVNLDLLTQDFESLTNINILDLIFIVLHLIESAKLLSEECPTLSLVIALIATIVKDKLNITDLQIAETLLLISETENE